MASSRHLLQRKTWPRLPYTEDQAGEVERLKALGATEAHWTSDQRTPTT